MIEVETPQEIEVVSNGIDVEARSLDVEVVDLKELDVTVAKREFVITGDDIYVPKLYDDAPQWMKDLVQLVVNSAVDTGNASTLAQLASMLSQFATSYVPLNQYTQSILDLSNADANIHTVIETLNSNYNNGLSQANAQIISLQNTKASKDEVVTQVVNTLAAQLANPTSSLGAAIGNLQQTIVNNQNANALSMQTLTASLEDVSGDVSSNATVINNALAYVGINSAGASTGTGLSAYVQGSNGQFGSAGSGINNQISVATTGVESKWAYNSSLTINGTSYNSGFGLSNSAGTGAGSEFWINADKLKFTNNGKTGSKAPFTIDASGSTPQITFNGLVSFSNVSNVPQLGSTPQQVVDAVNNGQTTTINGGKITTGSIGANQINVNDVFAQNITYTGTITGGTGGSGGIIKSYNGNMVIDLVNGSIYIA